MAFHWRDGWFFERTDDGSVHVWHEPTGAGIADIEFTVPAPEWASIVASVSALGETGDTFYAVLNFHNGVPFSDD